MCAYDENRSPEGAVGHVISTISKLEISSKFVAHTKFIFRETVQLDTL